MVEPPTNRQVGATEIERCPVLSFNTHSTMVGQQQVSFTEKVSFIWSVHYSEVPLY